MLRMFVFLLVMGHPIQLFADSQTAIFAGGCFWCVEADFDQLPGVVSTTSGYTAGKVKDPTYKQVTSGRTGHTEAVKVEYDPSKIKYEELVEYFWKTIDPTVKNRQFCDIGNQYRTGIYPLNKQQERIAQTSKTKLEKSGRFDAIYTEIADPGPFYPAETYHQDYYLKNPIRYKYYRNGCGRDRRLREIWGE